MQAWGETWGTIGGQKEAEAISILHTLLTLHGGHRHHLQG